MKIKRLSTPQVPNNNRDSQDLVPSLLTFSPIVAVTFATFLTLTHRDAWTKFSALDVDVQFIDASLSADKPKHDVSCWTFTLHVKNEYTTYRVRPSSVQAKPAVLSGDGGTSKTP